MNKEKSYLNISFIYSGKVGTGTRCSSVSEFQSGFNPFDVVGLGNKSYFCWSCSMESLTSCSHDSAQMSFRQDNWKTTFDSSCCWNWIFLQNLTQNYFDCSASKKVNYSVRWREKNYMMKCLRKMVSKVMIQVMEKTKRKRVMTQIENVVLGNWSQNWKIMTSVSPASLLLWWYPHRLQRKNRNN